MSIHLTSPIIEYLQTHQNHHYHIHRVRLGQLRQSHLQYNQKPQLIAWKVLTMMFF